MQLDDTNDPPAPLETRVRFSLRSLLIGTAVAAACLAAVAPWFQEWNAEQRKAFLLVWLQLGLGAGAAIVAGCVQRVHSEKLAGLARYRLPLSLSKAGTPSALGIVWFLLSATIAYSFDKASSHGVAAAATPDDYDSFLIYYGFMLGMAVLGLWWRTESLELCDAGILRYSRFIPWKTIRGFRWGASNPNLLLVQCGWSTITVCANPADKPAIERFLVDRLAENRNEPKQAGPASTAAKRIDAARPY